MTASPVELVETFEANLGKVPAIRQRTATVRRTTGSVETSPPESRRWDVAPLIMMGVALALLGSRWETLAGAVLTLAGFLLWLAALGRWGWRARHLATAPVSRQSVTTSV